MAIAGRTNRTKFRDQVLNPLLQDGLLEMTIPEKPNSSLQKYRLPPAGRDLIEKVAKEGGVMMETKIKPRFWGIWQNLNHQDFNPIEFDCVKMQIDLKSILLWYLA